MKIKAVQIANELGISKATVSLALNGKPGVSEQTRKYIHDCKEKMERGEFTSNRSGRDAENGIILVIKAMKGYNIIYNAEIDLWTDVLAVFEREARKIGYMTSVVYMDLRKDSVDEIIQQCRDEKIKGVFLVATELSAEDILEFEKIEKPMVLYDNESPGYSHYSIVPDNYRGVETAVKYLLDRNYRDIVYLANDRDIYNFAERRRAFFNTMAENNLNPYNENRIVRIGTTINDVYVKGVEYLKNNKLPQAYIMENYQVSIGMMRALQHHKIKIPDQIALIGVDVVPDYITYNCKLTVVRIPHTDRAIMAMHMLEREINDECKVKSRILTDCRLIEGESTGNMNIS